MSNVKDAAMTTASTKPGRSRSPPEGSAEAKRAKDEAAAASAAEEEEKQKRADAVKVSFMENWAAVQPQINTNIMNLTQGVVTSQLEDVHKKMNDQSKRLDTMDEKLEANAKDLGELKDGMAWIKEKLMGNAPAGPVSQSLGHSLSAPDLSAGPAVTPPQIPFSSQNVGNNPFFRDINPRILFFNTHGKEEVTKEEVVKALTPLMLEANIPESGFQVVGDPLDFQFEIVFPGDFSLARSRASQFKLSLRLTRGKYKTQQVETPSKTSIQFYINPDKNGSHVRTEILTKGITDALNNAYTDKSFMCSRAGGLVYCNRRALARITVLGEDSARLSWNIGTRVALGIEPATIDAAFSALVSEKGGQWS